MVTRSLVSCQSAPAAERDRAIHRGGPPWSPTTTAIHHGGPPWSPTTTAMVGDRRPPPALVELADLQGTGPAQGAHRRGLKRCGHPSRGPHRHRLGRQVGAGMGRAPRRGVDPQLGPAEVAGASGLRDRRRLDLWIIAQSGERFQAYVASAHCPLVVLLEQHRADVPLTISARR